MNTHEKCRSIVFLIVLVSVNWVSTGAAAIITIDNTLDTIFENGNCTLREAIVAANTDLAVDACVAGSGADQLNFSIPGTVHLTSNLPTISDEISINGFSTTGTVIDGGGVHRIFEIHAQQDPSELAVSSLSGITLTRGLSGAMNIRVGNSVEVNNTTIINNVSSAGAGISLQNSTTAEQGARLSLVSSNIASNIATGPAGGAGIRAGIGSNITISSSSIVGNRAIHPNASGGGILLFGGGSSSLASSAVVTNSTIAVNVAYAHGGGISVNGSDTRLDVVSSTITSNISDGDLAGGGGIGAGVRIGPATIVTFKGSIIATNFRGFLADDVGVPGSASPPSITSGGFNLIGTNLAATDYFPPGQPNTNKDFVGTTDDTLNAEAMLEPLAFDENSQTYFRAFSDTSLAFNNAGQCDLEFDQLQSTRGVCECDIGAYELPESSPDNRSCKSDIFVLPLDNGNTVIIDL